MPRRILISLLLLTGLVACQKGFIVFEEDPTLGIVIDFPESAGTRGDVGMLPASDLENAIHSLTVWVFRNDDSTLVAAKALAEEDFPVGGGIRRYSLPVGKTFVKDKPNVDVFVLANAESIGISLDTTATYLAIDTAWFGNSSTAPYYGFGIEHPVTSVDPDLGLPMSGCEKNLKIEGEEPVFKVKTIKIKRMVSRLRLVFCKTKTIGTAEEEERSVSIDRIILGGSQIAKKEYLFTTKDSGVKLDETPVINNYDASAYIVNWPSGTEIAENDTPETLIYVNQDPITYENIIKDAVDNNTLTDLGYTYLRESDKRLTGRVDYTVNDVDKKREFNMLSEGDFARNRTWTVFGYFLSGRNLQLSLNVQPWDYNSFVVDFSNQSVNCSKKFYVDEKTVDRHGEIAYLISGTAARGHLTITTPVGGRLMIKPIGDASAFTVSPEIAPIDPTHNAGRIDISVNRTESSENLKGKYITLSFSVMVGGRETDANSEIVDQVYKFTLTQ